MSIVALFVLFGLSGTVVGAEDQVYDQALPWNANPLKSACPDEASYAWVMYSQDTACIRYFASPGIAKAAVVIVQFYGDRDRIMGKAPEDIRNNTRRSQEHYAQKQADRAGIPLIVVARPGTYGSSGDHRRRRQAEEFLVINAALDVIKHKHGIKRLVLLGHSGGATVGAALLTLGRTDIQCAVLTSGAYNLIERHRLLRLAEGKRPRLGLDATGLPHPYDPLDHVDGIVHDAQRRVYIFGDPRDTVTPFPLQRQFAHALARQGHWVLLDEYPAVAPEFHNLQGGIGLKTAAECAR